MEEVILESECEQFEGTPRYADELQRRNEYHEKAQEIYKKSLEQRCIVKRSLDDEIHPEENVKLVIIPSRANYIDYLKHLWQYIKVNKKWLKYEKYVRDITKQDIQNFYISPTKLDKEYRGNRMKKILDETIEHYKQEKEQTCSQMQLQNEQS